MSRGLKFTPTPMSNKADLIKDTDEFCRKLRLREFFGSENFEDEALVRNKKGTVPQQNRDRNLENYIDCLKKEAESNNTVNPVKSNISKEEFKALKELQNDNSIVIKQSDKGGGIIIMDAEHYQQMVYDQLNDRNFYSKVDAKVDKKTFNKVCKLVDKFKDNLHKNEADYLKNFEIIPSNFYGLPKIHKSKDILNYLRDKKAKYVQIPKPRDLKLRPIIGGPSSNTQRLSNLLDIILKPLCKMVPSFIRDDLDFLNYIPNTVNEGTLLVSFDVTSLYTNIPHELGYEAITYWLEKHPELINQRFPKEFILEGLQVILENNTFFFDKQCFLQTKGTAMGTKVAPTYATLVMGYLENKMYESLKESFDEEFSNYIQQNWKRFLDDCFIFWTKSKDDLNKFHSEINKLNESIKFTMESDEHQLPFLDILIKNDNNSIITDLYSKETDTHQYLNFRSCHPSHTKRNIPFSLARRICTIVINPELRTLRLKELKTYLLRQDYPENLIDSAIRKAITIPVNELRRTKDHQPINNEIPFVITHNPRNHNVHNSARKYLPILHQSPNLKELIPESSIINSRRQPPNLKRLLTKSKFESEETEFKVTKCGDKRCGTCAYIDEGNSITFKSGTTFRINASMNCKSENLIYCATCPTCKENYIGQTGDHLFDRVRVHKQQIKDPSVRNTPCSEHFDKCGNGQFRIFPFFKIFMDSKVKAFRIAKEDHFIKKFKPLLNRK